MPTTPQSWFVRPRPRPDARWRLIGFPYGGGGPQAFRDWPDELGESVEVLAAHLPGRGSRLGEPPLDDLATLVEALADDLAQHTDKPFAFFGHSVGALLAFEVAAALQERGLPTPLRVFASAHQAPHVPHAGATMHDLPQVELVEVVRRLGLVPADALADEELLSLILPPLRADFALSETYRCPEDATLSVPITALGGSDDDLATAQDLAAWARHTDRGFEVRMYRGDHFYTTTQLPALAADLVDRVEADLAALPPSIMMGPRAAYPRDACLHELFAEQAARTPQAVALVDGERELTFAELDEQTDLLARALQASSAAWASMTSSASTCRRAWSSSWPTSPRSRPAGPTCRWTSPIHPRSWRRPCRPPTPSPCSARPA